MVSKQAPFELDEVVNAETNVGEWRSLYPGIPAEVVMGLCGPWTRNATPQQHTRAMLVFRLAHGFLNLGIEKTRALEEARRVRLVSVEAQKIMTQMRVLLLKKDQLTESLTQSEKVGEMSDLEIEARHKELANVGTEMNRLDDLLTGRRDERLWVSQATQRVLRGALYNRGLFDGKPAGVRLPYSLETHEGYTVPDGEVHLVWVTETVGGDRRHIVVHAVLWKERLAEWTDKTPVGYGLTTSFGPVVLDRTDAAAMERVPQAETISFGPPGPQPTPGDGGMPKTAEERLANTTSTLTVIVPDLDPSEPVSKRKVLTPEQIAIKKARFDDRIRRAKERNRLERLRKREEKERERQEKRAQEAASQRVGTFNP